VDASLSGVSRDEVCCAPPAARSWVKATLAAEPAGVATVRSPWRKQAFAISPSILAPTPLGARRASPCAGA
jgi:hypothetical protein